MVALQNEQPGLANLPVELVRQISAHLSSTKRDNLSALSKTCTRLCEIVQPMLFNTVSLGIGRKTRMVPFLRALVTRPDLARRVLSLVFHEARDEEDISEDDRLFIESCIASLGIPALRAEWSLGEGEYRLLLIELIIANTPSLEKLQIPMDYDWEVNVFHHPGTEFSLPNLKKLIVDHYYISGDRFTVALGEVEVLLAAAKNLEVLIIPTLDGFKAFDPDHRCPTAKLRRIEFASNCAVNPCLLKTMLASCPLLEVFALHWDALANAYEYTGDITVMDAWHALEQRRDSLCEIRLDIRNDLPLGHHGHQRCSLQDFDNLRVLKVNGHGLEALRQIWIRKNQQARADSFLSDLMPPGIREITIWQPDGDLVPSVVRFAKAVSVGRFPSLRRFVLAPSEGSDRLGERWEQRMAWGAAESLLMRGFTGAGVCFEILDRSNYWAQSLSR